MTRILNLPRCCTLVQAEDLAHDFRAALAEAHDGLRIDSSALDEADVSLLQLLVATQKSCAALGREFGLVLSPALVALAGRAGLNATESGLFAPG